MTAPASRLPDGFRVELAPDVRRADGGRTLFGGSPPRLVYLQPAARTRLAGPQLEVVDATSAALARLLLDRGLGVPVLDRALPGVPQPAQVSVVVPVRDRAPELARLLAALPGLAVIVVDDGSSDAEAVTAVTARAGARLLRRPRPGGPAAARNAGLAVVGTPLVAFIDSDVLPRPTWLATLLPHLADPAVGVVAPRVAALELADRPNWIARYESARSSLDLGPTPAAVTPRGRVAYLPSACLLARTAAVRSGFEESMHVGEDVDLVWRVIEAGWRVRYEPGAVVEHAHRVQPSAWLARKAFYGTGAAPLAVRHSGAVAPVVLSPWTAAVALLLLAQRRWSLPAGAAVTAAATWRLSRRLGRSDHPLRAAAALIPFGLVGALWQTAAALTRHWWPLAALGCLVSARMRRAVLAVAVLDGLADWRRVRPPLDPVRYVLARRLDDLAYGSGLWWGALRARTPAPLLPVIAGRRTS